MSIASTTAPDPEADREKPSARRYAALIPGFHDRPPFMLWLRLCWLDVLTQLLCVLTAFLIYTFVPPIMPRYFPLYPGIEHSAWGIKYGSPYRSEYITTVVSAVVSFAVPAVVLGAIGLWHVRSFWEGNAAIMGLGYALATATLFQSFIKVFIGGLRPHFLSICAPPATLPYSRSPTAYPDNSINHKNIFYTAAVCTGPASRVKEAQMSFPSGHACAAFAGFGFLALYLNAKYNCFTRGERGSHWKLMLFMLPWCVAVILAGSKVRDGWHHPVDVVFGALVGSAFAHMAFSMVFRSVYCSGENHEPAE